MKKTHPKAELVAPRDVIRVETALSRFPIHRLARQGTVPIAIRETDADGELTVRWEISHNAKYGQPGLLAYQLDTWVVNRRIDATGRPIPGLIRLGSLSDLCRELDLVDSGKNIRDIRRALYQNAFAAITAKIQYKARDRSERRIEIGDTRYAVVFTGEWLPDGRKADAVYLLLHDFYRQVLDSAPTRPLDYEYLRTLPPVAQRWYELASFQVYAALKHGQPRVWMNYGKFCTFAPQTRYTAFGSMRRQMERLHAVHRKAGYLAGVEFEATTDRDGRPDWAMIYIPGPKAQAEFQAFTRKGGPVPRDIELAWFEPKPEPEPEPEPTGLARELVERGVTRSVAAELVQSYPEAQIRAQVEQVDWLRETKPKQIKDLGAYLTEAIRKDFAPPAGFQSQAERAEAEAAARAALEREVEARKSKARAQEERDRVREFWQSLTC